jgi:histidinol dehydrogenase
MGLYIPGGTTPVFSTVLMLAIPAKIAGCKRKDGRMFTNQQKRKKINQQLYTQPIFVARY